MAISITDASGKKLNVASLGAKGADGKAGKDGKDGKDGKSAYQYAMDGGYTGTEEEFEALMCTGPWLPVKKGVVRQNVTIGDATGSKLILDGPDLSGPVLISPGEEPPASSAPVVIQARVLQSGSAGTSNLFLDISGRKVLLRNGLDLYGGKIENVGNPTKDDDAASKIYVDINTKKIPAGIITWIPVSAEIPSGYLACNGDIVYKYTYKDLYDAVGETYKAAPNPGEPEVEIIDGHFLPNIPDGAIPGMKAIIKT